MIDTSVIQNNEVLTANENGPEITYQWIDCNNGNAPITGETNQSFTATVNGNYAVVISNAICSISDTSACIEVIVTSTLDPDNGSQNFVLYPNPVVDNLIIKFGDLYQTIQISMFSVIGQLVKSVEIENSSDLELNMSDLPSGSYLLKMNTDGKTNSIIIIKE